MKSEELFNESIKYLPGGVNSPIRAYKPYPFFAKRGEGSKLYDNSGIDLMYIPFNIQIKAGVQRGIQYSQELKYVKDQIQSNFDKEETVHKKPIMLIHKKPKLEGKRERGEFDELVIMSWKDFETYILPFYQQENIPQTTTTTC